MWRILVLFVIALLVVPSGAQARSGNRTIQSGLAEIGISANGMGFKLFINEDDSSDSAFYYSFIGIELVNVDTAEKVVDQLPEIYNEILVEFYEDPTLVFTRVSAGQIGDSRYAAQGELPSDGFGFTVGYVMAQLDRYVVIGRVLGYNKSPVIEVAPFVADAIERIAEKQPDDDDELTKLLPQLDDMPPGYSDDDDKDQASLTLTPIAAQSVIADPDRDDKIHVRGFGNATVSDTPIIRGNYHVVFTCSAPTGLVEITLRRGDKMSVAIRTTDRHENGWWTYYDLPDMDIYLMEVTCAGSWTVDFTPEIDD